MGYDLRFDSFSDDDRRCDGLSGGDHRLSGSDYRLSGSDHRLSDDLRGRRLGGHDVRNRDSGYHGSGRSPGYLWLLRVAQLRGADFAGRGFQIERRCVVCALQRALVRQDAGHCRVAVTRTTPPAAAAATA